MLKGFFLSTTTNQQATIMIREKKKNVASSTPNANMPKTMEPNTGSSSVEKKEKECDVEYEVTYVGTPHQVGTTGMNPQM